jgi:protein-S-isoprenylcysteine O-methyltransferase Ste14
MLWFKIRRLPSGSNPNDRFSGPMLVFCLWIGITASLNLAILARSEAIPSHRNLVFGAGIALMFMGVLFRLYSIRILGKYFTTVITIQPGQTIIQNGPYKWIRHPTYSGAIISMLGLGLAMGNWLSVLIVMLAAIVGYSYRIFVEERALIKSFGDPYREYMKRTKRIIPFVI